MPDSYQVWKQKHDAWLRRQAIREQKRREKVAEKRRIETDKRHALMEAAHEERLRNALNDEKHTKHQEALEKEIRDFRAKHAIRKTTTIGKDLQPVTTESIRKPEELEQLVKAAFPNYAQQQRQGQQPQQQQQQPQQQRQLSPEQQKQLQQHQQQMQAAKQQADAANEAKKYQDEKYEKQQTPKQQAEYVQRHEALRRFLADESNSEDEKKAAVQKINQIDMNDLMSMSPMPRKSQFPKGQGPGEHWKDPITGNIVKRNPNGEVERFENEKDTLSYAAFQETAKLRAVELQHQRTKQTDFSNKIFDLMHPGDGRPGMSLEDARATVAGVQGHDTSNMPGKVTPSPGQPQPQSVGQPATQQPQQQQPASQPQGQQQFTHYSDNGYGYNGKEWVKIGGDNQSNEGGQ